MKRKSKSKKSSKKVTTLSKSDRQTEFLTQTKIFSSLLAVVFIISYINLIKKRSNYRVVMHRRSFLAQKSSQSLNNKIFGGIRRQRVRPKPSRPPDPTVRQNATAKSSTVASSKTETKPAQTKSASREPTLIEIPNTNPENYLSDQNHCQTKNNTFIIPSVAFLKTHKCGSSLFKHVMQNFDIKHPFYRSRKPEVRFTPYLGGYPGFYKREFDLYFGCFEKKIKKKFF